MSNPPAHPGPTGGFKLEPMYWLMLAFPAAIVLKLMDGPSLVIFAVACVAILPLAGLMGRATENLAETMGAGIGGLLNATFGNAAELIIALIALSKVHQNPQMIELVQASITGSILGNILLVLGLAFLCGGLKYQRQTFNRTSAGMGATLLALAAIGLLLPTLFHEIAKAQPKAPEGNRVEVILSEEVAVVLLVAYGLSLLFSLRTHSHLFAGPEDQLPTTGPHHQPEWSRKTSLIVLLLATVGVAVAAEILIGSVEEAAKHVGMTHLFTGMIVVAIVGNAAEHSTAILVAMKNKMDLAVNIAVGSSIQIALFVAPVLVFASVLMGHPQPLTLHFQWIEVVAVLVSIFVVSVIAQDGETHWMEGVMLLAVYAIIALTVFHMPERHPAIAAPHSPAG